MCSFLLLLLSEWKNVRLASTGSYASSSQSLWCSSARLVGSHFSEVQVQVHSCLSLCWKESALASIHSRWSSAFLSWCFPSLLHGCCWQVTWNLQVQSGKVLLASVVQKYWLAMEEIFPWYDLHSLFLIVSSGITLVCEYVGDPFITAFEIVMRLT